MIKIDWQQLLWNHVWFGFYLDFPIENGAPKRWNRVNNTSLEEHLWPMREYGEPPPYWWWRLWNWHD